MKQDLQAFRVHSCIPLSGEKAVSGTELFAPLYKIDDCLVLTKNDTIVYLGKYSPKVLPAGEIIVHDLGDEVLVPCAINAHTHVQLSHTTGKTLWGEGFVPWLQSLIALLPLPLVAEDIERAVGDMKRDGIGFFADFTSSGIAMVEESVQKNNMQAIYLAEWFGFSEKWHEETALPERVRVALEKAEKMTQDVIPCGHALYSTAPEILQKAKKWCSIHKKPFVIHLAEFAEEVEALTTGKGALVDLFAPMVLPRSWKAPGMRPVDFAKSLGLLDEKTLAVHCVHCTEKDVRTLSEARASVCLCPRSNAFLAVGTAPFWEMAHSAVNLCLGTDGLSSNIDLNIWNEASYLRDKHDFPIEALLRMLTVNAAKIFNAHGAGKNEFSALGSLECGSKACWTFMPKDWEL